MPKNIRLGDARGARLAFGFNPAGVAGFRPDR
jgi:hypothetical protein